MSSTTSPYAPPAFAATDPAAIVRQHPFASLVTTARGDIYSTQAPVFFEFEEDDRTMIGHLARANVQAQAMVPDQAVLAIFLGPHTYITSSWYRHKLTVPTWNYISAQVRGTLDPIDGPEAQLRILERTASLAERHHAVPWSLADAPPGRVALLLPMIRSFRITVGRIDGVTKLNQTHPVEDQRLIVERLRERDWDGDRQIAALMTARLASLGE